MNNDIENRKNSVDDYIERGGLLGCTMTELKQQLSDALLEKRHPLKKVAQAMSEGNVEDAADRLIKILKKASRKPKSPLYGISIVLYIRLKYSMSVHYALEHINNNEILINIPSPIVKIAAVIHTVKALGASGGSKKKAKQRAYIIQKWDACDCKEKGYSWFASRLFKEMKGEYGADGNKIKNGVPSERTIAKIISEYERGKTPSPALNNDSKISLRRYVIKNIRIVIIDALKDAYPDTSEYKK